MDRCSCASQMRLEIITNYPKGVRVYDPYDANTIFGFKLVPLDQPREIGKSGNKYI